LFNEKEIIRKENRTDISAIKAVKDKNEKELTFSDENYVEIAFPIHMFAMNDTSILILAQL
jgi:hypothetical protein